MKNNKFLLITKLFPPGIGGVQNYYYNLLMNCNDINITLLTQAVHGSAEIDRSLELKGVKVFRCKCFPKKMDMHIDVQWLFYILKLFIITTNIVTKRKIDYIIVGQAKIYLLFACYIIGLVTSTKMIVFMHGEEIPTVNFKSNGLYRYLLRKASFYIINSEFTHSTFCKFMNTDIQNYVFIKPGVDEKYFQNRNEHAISTIKKELHIQDHLVLYTIARLDERKGHDMVIKALPLILKRHPRLIYLIGGEGARLEYLKQLAEEFGVASHVIFLGLIAHDRIVDYHNVGDVFIMPNRRLEDGDTEGFGKVFLEANAVGKPVIGGRAGGAINAIEDCSTGFLVNPNDVSDIAERVCWLMEHPDKAAEMGLKGRDRAWAAFRWQYLGSILQKELSNISSHEK